MIDLTPFEPCTLQLLEYLTKTLGIQAPGPRRGHDEHPVVSRRADLECRRCGQSPAQTGDDVSDQAVAFTCVQCLMAEAEAYESPTRAIDIACALDGQHKSERWASECPVRRSAQEAPHVIETSDPLSPYGSAAEATPDTCINSGDSARVSITRASRSGARRGGRPRKHASDLIARREASRQYRARARRKADDTEV